MMHHIVLSAFDKQVKDAKKAFKDYREKNEEKVMIQSEEQKEYNRRKQEFEFKSLLNRSPF